MEPSRGAVLATAEVAGMAVDADAVVGGAAVDCPNIVEAADTRLLEREWRRTYECEVGRRGEGERRRRERDVGRREQRKAMAVAQKGKGD